MTVPDSAVIVEPRGRGPLVPARLARVFATTAVAVAVIAPLVMVRQRGGDSEALEVAVAFVLAYSLFVMSRLCCISLFNEAERAPERIVPVARQILVRAHEFALPLVAVLVVGAHWWLAAFRDEWAEHGTMLLRVLALSVIPCITTTTFLGVARVQHRTGALLAVTGGMAFGILTLSAVLLSRFGVSAVGWAWLLTQTFAATVLLLGDLRTLWLVPLPVRRPGAAARVLPVRETNRSTGRSVRRDDVRRALDEIVDAPHLGRLAPGSLLADNGDVYVFHAPANERIPASVLRVAHTDTGRKVLASASAALVELDRIGAFASQPDVVPQLLSASHENPGSWTLETRCLGAPPSTMRLEPADLTSLVHQVADRIQVLHRVTATAVVPGDDASARLVDQLLARLRPVRTVALRRYGDAWSVEKLRAELYDAICDRQVTMSYVHGDLWLGNTLCDERANLTGIVDWDRAGRGMPAVETMQLVCTSRAWTERAQLGAVVRRLLEHEDWYDDEIAVVRAAPGGDELPLRTLLLLSWLAHVDANLRKSSTISRSSVWRAHNVLQVLEAT